MRSYSEWMAKKDTTTIDGSAGAFVLACCRKHKSYRTRSSIMWEAYQDWAYATKAKKRTRNQFVAEMRELGIYRQRGGVCWCMGVTLKDPDELRALGMDGLRACVGDEPAESYIPAGDPLA